MPPTTRITTTRWPSMLGFSPMRAPRPARGRGRYFRGPDPTISRSTPRTPPVPAAAPKTQAITASVDDALRLGCSASASRSPGSSMSLDMFSDIAEMRREAASVVSQQSSGPTRAAKDLDKDGETAADVTAYAAHIAALLGAHIIKVKLSTDHLSQKGSQGRLRKGRHPGQDAGGPRARMRALGAQRAADHRFLGRCGQGEDSVLDDGVPSATAAATGRSSGATASSGRAKRR